MKVRDKFVNLYYIFIFLISIAMLTSCNENSTTLMPIKESSLLK